MKILHTSDWHFGMPAGLGTYEENQRAFLDQLCAIIQREGVGAVLCAGDVYDSGLAGAAAIQLYNDAVTAVCGRLGVPMVMIAGNHDSAPRLSACRELLQRAGLYVTGRLVRDIEPVLLGKDTAVYPLPYFNRDEVSALFPERREEIRSLEDAFQVVCGHIRETMDPGRRNIVLAHAYVVGAQLSESDRSARVGYAAAVSKDVFDGFDYVALGHIHSPQSVGRETVRYCGTPLKYSFSEAEQEKSVTVLEMGEKGDVVLSTVPLVPLRDMRKIRGSYGEVMSRSFYQDTNTEDYVQITLTDEEDIPDGLQKLRTVYPNLMQVAYDNSRTRQDRTVEAAEQAERKSELELFGEFFELQNNQPMSAEQAAYMEKLIADLK